MNKLVEWFDGSAWWHMIAVCVILMFPGWIMLEYIQINVLALIFIFWGGEVYYGYLTKIGRV